ncbi:uncharacterized protein PHALS_15008 [Plasmopara halstedii]|uniref:Uncharacterized protein n=1 Tax=Plasmopara halstedii TaxID=4781 RepID=A0A0P1A690_PLAHL|nr:uncharacterized protein PHALS_15008 [Plasmopara halstedii]CEG36093.1 hypothetical protein PHALS_15008 [Plasmopara halstedii]|eukprot:XP_024572462.1 hypothetical protein PHALS_15008 [Plasmopara halstedii]
MLILNFTPHSPSNTMCKMITMKSGMPPFFVDPAITSTLTKPQVLLTTSLPIQHSSSNSQQEKGVSFKSEAFRLRTQAKILELVQTANNSSDICLNNSLIAKKVLKYRCALKRHPFESTSVELIH